MPAERGGRAWLEEVRVQGLALLENVEMTFSPGLNVVSGETGEGKSLLLQGINLLLGARARRGLVRRGASQASVEGRFRLHGVDLSDVTDLVSSDAAELCLRRVVTAEGSSRAYVDGAIAPVGLLARLGARLVDVHGQRHSLLRAADQRAVLDRFCGGEDLAQQWRDLYEELASVRAERAALREGVDAAVERLEFLRFQLRELEEAEPALGEEAELTARLKTLHSAQRLQEILMEASGLLHERDGAVGENCARLARQLEETGAAEDGPLSVLRARLESLGLEAEDLGRECGAAMSALDADGPAAQQAEERLTVLRGLARRHRVEPDDLPERMRSLQSEVRTLEDGGQGADEELGRRESALTASLSSIGLRLWELRRKGAARLQKAIKPALTELRMQKAVVRVCVEPTAWPTELDSETCAADGPGPVRFLVAANPGEPEQPVEDVASGGELARILLAIKGALAGAHGVPLLIFDEIDAGVGGRVGIPFGRRIGAIAAHHQVLVVTHLPQVAAFADRHLVVRKEVTNGRTRTAVLAVDGAERVSEVAAMLGADGGDGVASAAARTQAEALIQEAGG